MGMNSQITALSEKIANDLLSTGTSRGSLGGGVAFGWTEGLPPTIASFVEKVATDGMNVEAVKVSVSGTPAAITAPSASKPVATAIAGASVALKKFAGQGTWTLEQTLTAPAVAHGVAAVLGGSCVAAFEADAIATLEAATGTGTGTGTTWSGALLSAQASVLAAGGVPGLTILSPTGFAALMGEVGGGAGYAQDPESAVGAFFGSRIHISPTVAATKGYVLDVNAVAVFEHSASPLAIVDAVSSRKNEITVLLDVIAATVVTRPSTVAKVTYAPARTTRA